MAEPDFKLGEYESLKQKMASARAMQRKLDNNKEDHTKSSQKVIEELREELKQQAQMHEEKCADLKRSSTLANDRLAKMRSQAEKDKKAWQVKTDRLRTQLENVENRHAEILQEMRAAHQAEVTATQEDLECEAQRTIQQLQHQLTQCKAAAQDREREVKEEQDALRIQLEDTNAKGRQELASEVASWQARSAEATELCEDLRAELARKNDQLAHLQSQLADQHEKMETQLNSKDERLELAAQEKIHLLSKVARLEDERVSEIRRVTKANQEALAALKAKQDAELDSVHKRVQQAIQKKDQVIVELRSQVVATTRSLHETEAILNKQKLELSQDL